MRYYSLKYVDKLPGGVGGQASMWKIKILEKYRDDKGLLEHEKFHVRCWWYCLAITWLVAAAMFFAGTDGWWISFLIAGPGVHSLLYRIKYFRKLAEVKAYKIQLEEGEMDGFGIATWDENGVVILDPSKRISRYLGSFSTGTQPGSKTVSVPSLTNQLFFFSTDALGGVNDMHPDVTLNGTTFTWSFPSAVGTVRRPITVHYGDF